MPGFTMVPNELISDQQLNHTAFRVLVGIFSFCYGNKLSCFPGIDTIVKTTSVSRSQVIKSIKYLTDNGYIKTEKTPGKSNSYNIDKYQCFSETPAQNTPVSKNDPSQNNTPVNMEPVLKKDPTSVFLRPQGVLKNDPNNTSINNTIKNTLSDAPASEKKVSKKREDTKTSQDSDPRITGLFKHYHDEHLRVYGTKPYISGGKDGKIFKRMLEQLTATEIKERMTRFFNDPLDRLKDPHHTLPLFESMINRYSSNGYKPVEPEKKAYDPKAWFEHHVIMTPLIPSEQRFPYKVRASVYWDIFYSFTLRVYGEDYHENEEKVIKINRALIKEGKINGWEEDYYKITGRNPDTNVQYQV